MAVFTVARILLPLVALVASVALVACAERGLRGRTPDIAREADPTADARSPGAVDVLAAAGADEPPRACLDDRECASFVIAEGCCSAYHFGITATKLDAYLAENRDRLRIPSAQRCSRDFTCPVEWRRAERGPAEPPAGTAVAVRCVRIGGADAGRCTTLYVPVQRHVIVTPTAS